MGTAISSQAQKAMRAKHADPASLVIGPARAPQEPVVVFYQLSRKFVDNERSVDPDSTDIVYYTLAVGHHTGVIDCFSARLSCPLAQYRRICALVEDDAARYKLEGILRQGEIQVDQESLAVLDEPIARALEACGRAQGADGECRAWLEEFSGMLQAMKRDRVLYLMGRERRP
ncbi:formate hydrogenlyase maturation HycH family protein [Curtanaerobium respiraculi]|uniref:formate hydrogenlyase maturation HycH family protein n=1 Tax=Curtanaerobium respiraculi TaxID=2949669 RepID=UPI0024B33215|nr:formate hydrogenlyase maturation HycH family protein [Curtanaerobium respiraculi]